MYACKNLNSHISLTGPNKLAFEFRPELLKHVPHPQMFFL